MHSMYMMKITKCRGSKLKDQNKCSHILCSWIGKLNIVKKRPILPKSTFAFDVFQTKSNKAFGRIGKPILKFTWEDTVPKNSYNNLTHKNKVGNTTLLILRFTM